MVLPNFLGIGVGKSGTTSLHYVLRQHPDVLLVPDKEGHYFNNDDNYQRGAQWYANKFAKHAGQQFVGDITPSYFIQEKCYRRIEETLGRDTKLILILRQPVTRAFSHYLHVVRLLQTCLPFVDAAGEVAPVFVNASRYAQRLKALLEVFPRENLLVLVYERDVARGNLAHGYRKIAAHLGLTEQPIDFDVHMVKAFIPRITRIVDAESQSRFPGLPDVEPGDVVVETVRNSDAGLQPELVKSPSAEKLDWYKSFEENVTRELKPAEIRALTEKYFAADIAEVREILGDSIPEWEEAFEVGD